MSNKISAEDWKSTLSIAHRQIKETVTQEAEGVTVRLATLTCPCGIKRAIVKMYQCLYCGVWFCRSCAEAHFGKTVEDYRRENPIEGIEYKVAPEKPPADH